MIWYCANAALLLKTNGSLLRLMPALMGLVAVVVAVVCMGFPLVCVLVGLAACGSCGPTLARVWASKKARTNCQVVGGAKNRANTISGVCDRF
jgi:hypothetical protein